MKLLDWNLMGLLVFSIVAVGCTKKLKSDTPEGALEKYVQAAFEAKSVEDKGKLLELSTGDALAFLETMSDENFKKHFIDSSLEFVSMKTKDLRNENNGDVSLVYELSFKEGKLPGATVYTNKKIAYLHLDQEANSWKIKATKNLRNIIEMKQDLVITPETTDQKVEPQNKK